MKTLTLLFITLLGSIGCTNTPSSVTVDQSGVITATGAKKFGGKNMIYAKSGESTVIIADNNDDSIKELGKSFRFGAGALAATDIFNTVTGGLTSVKNTKTAAGVSTTGLKEKTAQIGLEEATKQKALDIELEALKLGAGE